MKDKTFIFDEDALTTITYNPKKEMVVIVGRDRFGWLPFVPPDVLQLVLSIFERIQPEAVQSFEKDLHHEILMAYRAELTARITAPEAKEAEPHEPR